MAILDRQTLSTLLGYSSIFAWLGAQLPQLFENWRNGSVEGLALPFLVSWLAGDATNLLGCVLTHQLPFQTYLAIYFVLVDVGLMSQYIYYARRHPIPEIPPLAHSARRAHQRAAHSEPWLSDRNRSKKRRSRGSGATRGSVAGDDPMSRSWMSESSAGHSPASSRPHTIPSLSRQHSVPPTAAGSESTSPSSVHTERGRTLSRPARTNFFGGPLETISGSPASGSPGPHGMLLGLQQSAGLDQWPTVPAHRNPSSTSRSRPPPSARRSSSMVFLSVGLLVGFGRWSIGGDAPVGMGVGRAWSTGGAPLPRVALVRDSTEAHLQHPVLFSSSLWTSRPSRRHEKRQTFPVDVYSSSSRLASASSARLASRDEPDRREPSEDDDDDDDDDDGDYPYPKRDLERFIGRASAWTCTTLYLTSRLPQIWQNFRRRSVEGLAIMLFVMAFVGNSLYVLSILTNPLASHPGYLLESTPYLLGSGGTLCFDITIVLQSILYSDKRKARQERERRRSGRHGLDAEEAAALLDEARDAGDEDDEDEGMTTGDETTTPSRSRSISQSRRGRSISSRGHNRKRSDTTELIAKVPFAGPYNHEHGPGDAAASQLEGRKFEFGEHGEEQEPEASTRRSSRSLSRAGRSRAVSAEPVILEEGESSVTIRP